MDQQEWTKVSDVKLNSTPESTLTVPLNNQPMCPNMSNAEFRALIMKLRDTAVSMIDSRYLALARYWNSEQERVRTWFGRADEDLKQMLLTGLPKLKTAMLELKSEKIVRYDDELSTHLACTPALPGPGVTAAVCKPDSAKRIIAVYEEFCTLPDTSTSKTCKLKTLIHECTHYIDTFDTIDTMYGSGTGLAIWAKMHPEQTATNADNIACYIAN